MTPASVFACQVLSRWRLCQIVLASSLLGRRQDVLFAKPITSADLTRRLVGLWRATAVSGSASNLIEVTFNSGGDFLLRTRLDVRGKAGAPVTQVGRFRVEPIDKRQFRLFLTDEFGVPMSSSVRRFVDSDTMMSEIGHTLFRRLTRDSSDV